MKRLMTIFFLAALLFQPLFANEAPVQAEMTFEQEAFQEGLPVWAMIKLDIAAEWHAYWKNPGETGFPTDIAWSLPEGWSVGVVKWSTPERIVIQDLVNYGYHEELIILTELIPPKTIKDANVELKAEVKWLVCSNDTCLPGSKEFVINMPVVENAPKVHKEKFETALKKVPEELTSVSAEKRGDHIVLTIDELKGDHTTVHFYPESSDYVQEVIGYTDGKELHLALAQDTLQDCIVKGVVLMHDESGNLTRALSIEAPLDADLDSGVIALSESTDVVKHSAVNFDGGFLWALIFAFAGGLILNLMPCVLPVISLKIFSFVKMADDSRAKIARHGILFTLGVLVSFWALAGVLIALQASGAAVGWGFQLQDPLFVGILASIIFIFALSLFGLFEFGTMFSSWAGQKQSDMGQSSGGSTSAFFSGVLATTVATPCTGPFLGPAIGFAMTLSALGSLTIFTFLALGMAFPYLIISLFPSLIRFLPKPGNWMITFKEILGFCMVATALWLVWVFAAQTSLMATTALLVALFVMSFACWVYGKWATPLRGKTVRYLSFGVTLAFLAFGSSIVVKASGMVEENTQLIAMSDPQEKSKDIRAWEPFNKERLEYLRSQGTPVFIDYTARWCLICQANHMVLSTQEVEDKLADAGVVKMLGDWTKNNPEITAELKKFGRSGVPLYLLYGKDAELEPEILPQVLSPDLVIQYVDTVL